MLDTLRGIIKRYGKAYCFVTHDTLLEKLREYHNKIISKRTLCYWLKALEDKGLIYRIRRLSWERWKPTVYYLLDRGGWGVVRAKKAIGVFKRLAQILPSRAQKIANDMNTTSMKHSGVGLNYKRPNATGKTGTKEKGTYVFKVKKAAGVTHVPGTGAVFPPAPEKPLIESAEPNLENVRKCQDIIRGLVNAKEQGKKDTYFEQRDKEAATKSRLGRFFENMKKSLREQAEEEKRLQAEYEAYEKEWLEKNGGSSNG